MCAHAPTIAPTRASPYRRSMVRRCAMAERAKADAQAVRAGSSLFGLIKRYGWLLLLEVFVKRKFLVGLSIALGIGAPPPRSNPRHSSPGLPRGGDRVAGLALSYERLENFDKTRIGHTSSSRQN